MALSSTDPKVLFGNAKCFACPTSVEQLRDQTYLLAALAGFPTDKAGVESLLAASKCMACLTTPQLRSVKAYLLALLNGLDTTQVGVLSLEDRAKCVDCLTPHQQFQVQTYLLALAAGFPTTVAGVRTIQANAKCFSCLTKKEQLEVQVYILTQLAPNAPTTAAELMAAAKCFVSCATGAIQSAVETLLVTDTGGRATPPCVTPTAPTLLTVSPSPSSATTSLRIHWKQVSNSGSLIIGWIIYWGTTSGVYTDNSGFRPAAFDGTYDITGLTGGTTYYVVVQAVTTIPGCVSSDSNEVSGTTAGGTPVGTNLVALWTMDEDIANGTRVDVIGGNNLTDDNNRIPAQRGLLNGAVRFVNGNTDSLSHADNADLGMGAGVSFSMVFWVMGTALNTGWIGERSAGGTIDYVYDMQVGTFTVFDLGGVARQVTIAPSQNNLWHMVAVGYDDATGVMWQQWDNSARSTLAISGVRKSGQPFRIQMDGGAVDQVGLWKRTLSTAEVTSLWNNRNGLIYPFSTDTGTQYANTWSWAVQHNGGAAPSAGRVTGLATAINALISNSLDTGIITLMALPAGNLTAALTAVFGRWKVQLGGNFFDMNCNPATNHNFVVGDLTANGLIGDAASKYLELVGISGTDFASDTSAGLTLYASAIGALGANTWEIGYTNGGGTSSFGMKIDIIGPTSQAFIFNTTTGAVSTASPGAGYYSINRTAAADLRLFFANSVNPHAQIGATQVGASGSRQAAPMYAFAVEVTDAGGAAFGYTPHRLSIIAAHDGWSSAQSSTFFSILQAMLTAWGGGFV